MEFERLRNALGGREGWKKKEKKKKNKKNKKKHGDQRATKEETTSADLMKVGV
jgi:hypothetical protein